MKQRGTAYMSESACQWCQSAETASCQEEPEKWLIGSLLELRLKLQVKKSFSYIVQTSVSKNNEIEQAYLTLVQVWPLGGKIIHQNLEDTYRPHLISL